MKIVRQKVVCIGGGTGLSTLLVGLKYNPLLTISAIVTMFDNGGSSGVLRDKDGILPSGDLARCIVALAPTKQEEAHAKKILLYRSDRDSRKKGAKNPVFHTTINMLMKTWQLEYGDYYAAVDELSRMLGIRGKVIPVAIENRHICSRFKDGTIAEGECSVDENIRAGKVVDRLYLDYPVSASPMATQAIQKSDLVVIGPGSFYTSVLPNFLPHGVVEAMRNSKAPVVYVANLFTEGRGMKGYSIHGMVEILQTYIQRQVSVVIANHKKPSQAALKKYMQQGQAILLPSISDVIANTELVTADLLDEADIVRHNAYALASVVNGISFCNQNKYLTE
jgi:uncharacterized cofD-like protein